MRVTARLAVLLVCVCAAAAGAQEPDPLVGHFVDATTGQSELLLVPAREGAPGELEGVLIEGEAAGGRTFELRGAREGELLRGRCSIAPGADGGEFVVAKVAEGLVFSRREDRAEVRFERVPGSSSDPAELRGVLARLLPPESDETAALRALKLLRSVQTAFLEDDGDGDGVRDYGTLAELGAAGRIDAALARGERRGYRFELRVEGADDDARWSASACPREPGAGRCFVTSWSGPIKVTKAPPVLGEGCGLPADAKDLGGDRPTGPDLSHVHPGQRYRYVMTNPGAPDMQMVFRVVAVEGVMVKYEITTLIDMGQGLQPVGDATPQEWRYEQMGAVVAPPQGAQKVDTRRESITVSGVRFDCLVTTVGEHSAWVPATGGFPTFPGIVKATTDGKVTMELVAIEE